MRWERDGVPVSGSAIYPDLIDPETATYSNILHVMNRQTGMYTCTATDGEHTLSLTQSFTVKGNSSLAASISLFCLKLII